MFNTNTIFIGCAEGIGRAKGGRVSISMRKLCIVDRNNNDCLLSFARFYLPGGKFTAENNGKSEEIDLEPISGKLKSWGPFTATLAESLEDLKKSGGVYNPRKLFMALTKIWQQFAGGDQHDSHELLRHLLESVKYDLFGLL